MYILILEEPKTESTLLRFIEIDTENRTARDVTKIFVGGIKAVKKLSDGTMWARGENVYGMKYNNWVRGVRSLFGPMTPEREAIIRKSCSDPIVVESCMKLFTYDHIMMGL